MCYKDKKEAIQGLPFFNEINDNEKDILLKSAKIRNYPKRTPLFFQGDQARNFMIVARGWIKLFSLTHDGEEIVIDMLGRGNVLGDAAIFDGRTYPFSAVAAEDAQLLEIPASQLCGRVWANPALAKHIITVMARKISSLRTENGHLVNMKAEQRLSCLLLRLSAWMKGKGGTFSLPYNKSIIALQLGIKLSTLSRVFDKLGDYGVTRKGAEININSFDALSQCCCSYCPVPKEICAGRRQHLKKGKKTEDD